MMNFWRRLGAWRWLMLTVAVILIFSMLGSVANFISTLFLIGFIYIIVKVFKMFTKGGYFTDREEQDEDSDSFWGTKPDNTVVKKHNPSAGPKPNGVITQSEQELFDELTSGLTDTEYDPPIPLQWSTLNPFRKNKKHDH